MAYEISFLSANVAIVHGVTDGTADTALDTLPPNPWEDTQVDVIVTGNGCYVEDDGTAAPRASGILAATIDIRSNQTGKFFVARVIKLTSGEGHVRDHSSVTT